MLFGMMFLYTLFLIYLSKKDYWKNFAKIVLVSITAFSVSLTFINNFVNNNQTTKQINNYVDHNFLSLLESNERSNGARYALIKSNLRIASNHIFLGVGKGLTGAYVNDNFTEEEKQNKEINMWVTNQKKEGVLRYDLGAMNMLDVLLKLVL